MKPSRTNPKAGRLVQQERLDDLNDPYRLFRCRTIMNCTEVCPNALVPSRAIEKIRLMMVKDSLPIIAMKPTLPDADEWAKIRDKFRLLAR